MPHIDESAAIADLEAKRYRAMLDGDVPVLREICSDDLSYTHSLGDRDDKESYLAKVASGVFTYHEIAHPADRILVLNGAALVTGRMSARVTVAGELRQIDNAYLAVWAKEDAGWKFVAYQPTPLPKNA